jgi:hypothetical protein
MEGLTKITAAPDINPTDVVTETGEILRNVVPEAKGYKAAVGQFLPLPEWLRELTNGLGVGDDILLGSFTGVIILILYLLGLFDGSPSTSKRFLPPPMMPQMQMQPQLYSQPGFSPYVQYPNM